jgi:hypothetical protein
MSKGKLLAARFLVLTMILVALVVAFPASATAPFACPESYAEDPFWPRGVDPDRNENGVVCFRTVNGEGNAGGGANVIDDTGGPLTG